MRTGGLLQAGAGGRNPLGSGSRENWSGVRHSVVRSRGQEKDETTVLKSSAGMNLAMQPDGLSRRVTQSVNRSAPSGTGLTARLESGPGAPGVPPRADLRPASKTEIGKGKGRRAEDEANGCERLAATVRSGASRKYVTKETLVTREKRNERGRGSFMLWLEAIGEVPDGGRENFREIP